MRVLIFHGYLLRGTGSNVYNAELAKALARLGHEVHLFCQDIHARELPWVDAVGHWDDGNLTTDKIREPVKITAYRPPIGRTLPVYVADRYERFDAKPINLLTDDEVESYIAANVAAVREIAGRVKPDAALANHAIMGPCILARALDGRPFAAKVHGSALEYQVKPYPRFKPYAQEGLSAARTILVGSRHTAESLWEAFRSSDFEAKTRLGPPGVDVDLFAPRDLDAREAGLDDLAHALRAAPRNGFSRGVAVQIDRLSTTIQSEPDPGGRLAALRESYDPAGIDELAPESAVALDPANDRIVSFVGKLIVSKGVDLLLLAWPLVRAAAPDAKLAITGFGAYREGLELLARALTRGDLEQATWLLSQGRALEGGAATSLKYGLAFLESLQGPEREAYVAAAADGQDSTVWFGRLEHDMLVHVVTASELQVVPSTFPEAYGMVAAEAAAAGAFPVVAAHSGLSEVARDLAPALDRAAADRLSFDLGPQAVRQLAGRIVEHLGQPSAQRAQIARALRQVAQDNFGWEKVAEEILFASDGQVERLRLA